MTGVAASNPSLEEILPVRESTSPAGAVCVATIETPIGRMIAGASETGLLFLAFERPGKLEDDVRRWSSLRAGPLVVGENKVLGRMNAEIESYFRGDLSSFETPVQLFGTPFQKRVWRGLTRIPYGETINYGAVAEQLGCPGAVRAVAKANAANRVAIVIPCHRVIGRNGELTGYAGGLEKKRYLLDLEARAAGRPVQSHLF